MSLEVMSEGRWGTRVLGSHTPALGHNELARLSTRSSVRCPESPAWRTGLALLLLGRHGRD